MACGYLDGRKGIPEFTEPAELRPDPIGSLPRVRTPRIDAIVREANVLIETEHGHLIDERALLKRQLKQHQVVLETSARESRTSADRLAEARVELTPRQLEQRRLAETDQETRPLGLVIARRWTIWDRGRAAAEQRHQSVTTQNAHAEHEARLCRDLIADREEAGRAAARRHLELAHRRIATYLQLLVRVHPQGRQLNGSLSEFQVGPELPEWAREPSSFRSSGSARGGE